MFVSYIIPSKTSKKRCLQRLSERSSRTLTGVLNMFVDPIIPSTVRQGTMKDICNDSMKFGYGAN